MSTRDHNLRFDTWEAFIAASVAGSDTAPSRATGQEFFWTETFADAVQLAHDGYDEILPLVRSISDSIADDIRPHLVETFVTRFDVSGGSVDVDRYLLGEPECLVEVTPIKVAKPGRVISILVNGGFRASVSANDIHQRGAAIAALVETLELLQHSTEVWVEATGVGPRNHNRAGATAISVLVKVKAAEEKLDLGRLLFAVAHASFHRRFIFSLREQSHLAGELEIFATAGTSVACRRAEEAKATIVLDIAQGSREALIHDSAGWIRQQLAEFGLIEN